MKTITITITGTDEQVLYHATKRGYTTQIFQENEGILEQVDNTQTQEDFLREWISTFLQNELASPLISEIQQQKQQEIMNEMESVKASLSDVVNVEIV